MRKDSDDSLSFHLVHCILNVERLKQKRILFLNEQLAHYRRAAKRCILLVRH